MRLLRKEIKSDEFTSIGHEIFVSPFIDSRRFNTEYIGTQCSMRNYKVYRTCLRNFDPDKQSTYFLLF